MSQVPMSRSGVVALIVTYNRKNLLEEALDAVLLQDAPLKEIIVIDNASNDGTCELFSPGSPYDLPIVEYRQMSVNLGGAGGFKEGIKAARESDCAWVWLMDDDCIVEPGTLSGLLRASEEVKGASFFASSVFGPKGEPMNVPGVDTRNSANGYADWYRELSKGLVQIRNATFVSLLISLDAVEEVGLPIGSFFIWGDDTEYTMRLTEFYGPAYLVGDSRVLHKRANVKSLDIRNEDNPTRIKNYRRYYKNNLIVLRYHGQRGQAPLRVFKNLLLSIDLLLRSRGKWTVRKARAGAVFFGSWDFVRHAYDIEDLGELLASEKGNK